MKQNTEVLTELKQINEALKALLAAGGETPITLTEAARFCKLSEQHFRKLVWAGIVKGHKNGKRWLFYTTELNKFIKQGGTSDGK
jgi:excisionase family DNA binding protein